MLAHVFNAGVRALAASIVLGGVLIYAVGGFESPDVRPLGGVIIIGFFIFWIVFVFLFSPRLPKSEERSSQTEVKSTNVPWGRARHRREDDEPGHDSDATADGNGHGDGS